VGGAAGFHCDQARLEIGKPAQKPVPRNRPAGDDALGGIDRVDLDDILGEVNADAGDRVHDFLLGGRLLSGPMIASAAGVPLAGQVLYQFKIRQVKYLNNVVEQDHRAIKRIIRPMLGFKDFRCARVILSGIEIMHMIAKGQMKHTGKIKPSSACQFYSLLM
jgi:hypothetical protein